VIEGIPQSRLSFGLAPVRTPAIPREQVPVAENPGDQEVYSSLLGQAKLRQAMQVYSRLDEAEALQDVQ
jgi:hypothetical protein